jgi:hypothetical protein
VPSAGVRGVTVEPEAIRCAGQRRNGRSCRYRIAERVGDIVVVRDGGRVHVDPASTTCPKCDTETLFRPRVVWTAA